MKPIKVEIEGLHSFVEKQIIDFSAVGPTNLFGIFGPTGSGKSTILDAIILALYGTVERSKTNSDFINSKSAKARVSFEFETTEKGKSKRYEIERVYKRKKDNSVEQIAQVFEKTTLGKSQVTEGAVRVDEFVKNTVGLTENEFTKCVALPQGAFAGFLKAKPSERINLIGSIFDLNKYGQELWEKIRTMAIECEKELAIVDGKLAMLADATDESISQLSSDADRLEKEIAEAEKQESVLEDSRKREQELADLITELNSVNKILKDNADLGASIKDKKEQINKARKINDSEFLITTVYNLDKQLQAEEKEIFDTELKYQSEENNTAELVANAKDRIEVCEKEIAFLIESKTRLELIKDDKEILDKLIVQRADCVKSSSLLEMGLVDLRQQKATINKNLQRIRKEYDKHKIEYANISKKIDELREVNKFEQYKDSLEMLTAYSEFADDKVNKALNLKYRSNEKALETVEKISKAEEELDELRKSVYNGTGSVPADIIDKEIKSLYAKINKCNIAEEFVVGKNKQVEELLEDLVQMREELRALAVAKQENAVLYNSHIDELAENQKSLEKAIARKMEIIESNSLAEVCIDAENGKACPVCSNKIVVKNKYDKKPLSIIDKEIESIRKNISLMQERRVNEISVISRLEQSIQNTKLLVQRTETQISKIKKEIAKTLEKTIGKANASVNDFAVASLKMKEELAELEKIKTKEKQIIKNIAKLENDKIKYNITYVSASEKCTEYMELIENLVLSKQAIEKEVEKIAPNEKAIAQMVAELNLNLLNRARVDEEIENLHKSICEHEETMRKITEMCANKESDAKVIAEQLKSINKQISEKEKAVVGYENVVNFKEEISYKLKEIESRQTEVENYYKSIEQIQEKLTKFASSLFSLKQSYKEHKENYELNNAKLLESLNTVGIVSIGEIENCRLSEDQIAELEKMIDEFDDNVTVLESKQKELEFKIDGRECSYSLIPELSYKIEQMENDINAKRENLGKIKSLLEASKNSLSTKTELVEKRNQLNESLKVQTELCEVLRGRALLEYVAEEYINDISFMASSKIQQLMDGRYVLKYQDKEFFVEDNFNNGEVRSVGTLSGGEVFVVSLALALSISDAIMSRSDKRMDFFFLDEGFGTLDKDYCEYIVGSLKKLCSPTMTIGLISHIPELQEKIRSKFLVEKPTMSKGTTVRLTNDL